LNLREVVTDAGGGDKDCHAIRWLTWNWPRRPINSWRTARERGDH